MSTAAELTPDFTSPPEALDLDCSLDNLTAGGNLRLPAKWRFNHGLAEDLKQVGKIQAVYDGGEKVGDITTYGAVLEDGSVHAIRDAQPAHQEIDTATAKTTAFGTQYARGMNLHHQIRDMRLGMRSILISRELAWEGPLDQGRTAYNMARLVKSVIENDDYVDGTNFTLDGLSRAKMIALGVKAMTDQRPELGLHCYYFNGAGPTFPEPLKLDWRYGRFPLTEVPSLFYHLMKLPPRLLLRYPGTLDANPIAAAANAKSLTDGSAGEFVDFISKDSRRTNGYIFVLRDDIMGMGKIWRAKFADHPGVEIEVAPRGRLPLTDGHLRIFNYADRIEFEARQQRLIEAKKDAANVYEIDFEYVNRPRRLKAVA